MQWTKGQALFTEYKSQMMDGGQRDMADKLGEK